MKGFTPPSRKQKKQIQMAATAGVITVFFGIMCWQFLGWWPVVGYIAGFFVCGLLFVK